MSGETESEVSGWTTDTLHEFMARRFLDLKELLDGRHAAQEKAMEKAYAAAQTALESRAAALDKEFHEHLEQYRHETRLVLEASDKAITKSETAMERRFESVNEFRAQLNDQASQFMPRTEAAALFDRNSERLQELTDRMNRSEGKGQGYAALYGWAIGAVGLLVAIIILANAIFGK